MTSNLLLWAILFCWILRLRQIEDPLDGINDICFVGNVESIMSQPQQLPNYIAVAIECWKKIRIKVSLASFLKKL